MSVPGGVCSMAWLGLLLWASAAGAQAPAVDPGAIHSSPTPGARLPDTLRLIDSGGEPLALASLLAGKPTVLMLGYYHCPNLCDAVWAGLASAISQIELRPPGDFQVLVASIDPQEGPAQARQRRAQLMESYTDVGVGDWHFATGAEAQIKALADAVGYAYAYDPAQRQYAHAAGLVVLDGQGRIARYLSGVQFEPQNLKLALLDAADGRAPDGGVLQAFANQVLLLCYHYDPSSGRYSSRIDELLKIGGVGTVLALGGLVAWLGFRGRQT